MTWDQACDAFWQDARDSLVDDLYSKLGSEPTDAEIMAFADDERIADRVSWMRENYDDC